MLTAFGVCPPYLPYNHRLRQLTPEAVAERTRRQRWTGKQIAAMTGASQLPPAVFCRGWGLNTLSALEPPEREALWNMRARIRANSSTQKTRSDRLRATSHRRTTIPARSIVTMASVGNRLCLHRRCLQVVRKLCPPGLAPVGRNKNARRPGDISFAPGSLRCEQDEGGEQRQGDH
jgi:hypothetical protein